MKEQRKIECLSPVQLRAMAAAGVLAPAAELLPGLLIPQAGRGAWLSVLLGSLLALGLWYLLCRVRDSGFQLPTPLLLIYMVWGMLLLSLRLRLCAQRLLSSGERDGSLGFFLLLLTLLLLKVGTGTLPAFGRAAQIFGFILFAAAGAVLLLSVGQCRWERVILIENRWSGVLLSALPAAGVLMWSFPAAFLSSEREKSKGRGLLFCFLLTVSQLIILACLGAGLAAQMDRPFFALAKGVGVEGAFRRVESCVAALWSFADLTMAGVLLFALRRAVARLWGEGNEQRGTVLILLGCAALARWGFTDPKGLMDMQRVYVPVGNLVLGCAPPLLLLLRRRTKK